MGVIIGIVAFVGVQVFISEETMMVQLPTNVTVAENAGLGYKGIH